MLGLEELAIAAGDHGEAVANQAGGAAAQVVVVEGDALGHRVGTEDGFGDFAAGGARPTSVDSPQRYGEAVKDFTAALGVAPACTIAFDAKTFGQAANNGQMIGECAPASKAHEALLTLTATITGRTAETKKKTASTSLIGKFFPKKK